MYDDRYGMCCSKEAAEQCARDYEKWVKKEIRKELIGIILSIAISSILIILAMVIFG